MAKRKINRSQAIRDYLGTNPSATPASLSRSLKKKGIKVSAALVSAVKYQQIGGGKWPQEERSPSGCVGQWHPNGLRSIGRGEEPG